MTAYNDLLSDIIAYLDAQNVATDGVNMFGEHLPTEPSLALMVETTGGFEADMKHGYSTATFRLLARSSGTDARPAKEILANAFDALHGFGTGYLVAAGAFVVSITAIQAAPVNIDRDENGRQRFSQNYQIEFAHATTHRTF